MSNKATVSSETSMQGIQKFKRGYTAKEKLLFCLMPPTLFGIAFFEVSALFVVATAVFSCWLMAILLRWVDGESIDYYHPGSLITGLLIGMTCSAATPLYMIVIGCCAAEFFGKRVFRNASGNVFNPAVLGRSAIAIFETIDPVQYADLSTGASTLFKSAGGIIPPEYLGAFLGTTKGAIGETSALLLIISGLIVLKYVVIKRHAAVALIITVPVAVAVLPAPVDVIGHAPWVMDPFLFLIGGPTLLMAFFFLTDPSTTPKTPAGGVIFGVGVGVMAVLGKLYTSVPGVEMYGILLMNLLTPTLNKLTFKTSAMRYSYDGN